MLHKKITHQRVRHHLGVVGMRVLERSGKDRNHDQREALDLVLPREVGIAQGFQENAEQGALLGDPRQGRHLEPVEILIESRVNGGRGGAHVLQAVSDLPRVLEKTGHCSHTHTYLWGFKEGDETERLGGSLDRMNREGGEQWLLGNLSPLGEQWMQSLCARDIPSPHKKRAPMSDKLRSKTKTNKKIPSLKNTTETFSRFRRLKTLEKHNLLQKNVRIWPTLRKVKSTGVG